MVQQADKKQQEDQRGGYPGFEVSCTRQLHVYDYENVFELQFLVKASSSSVHNAEIVYTVNASVLHIDYESQAMTIKYINDCLPSSDKLNLSPSPLSPFNFVLIDPLYFRRFTLFNCSSSNIDRDGYPITCLNSNSYEVYAFSPDSDIHTLASCTKMYTILLPDSSYDFKVRWSKPVCGRCKAHGKSCRWKKDNNSSTKYEETECHKTSSGLIQHLAITGLILGHVLVLLLIVGLCLVIRSRKLRKEDQLKIETFLQDYRALKPTRYSYADIKKITCQFQDNIGQGGYGTVYKGNLSNNIFVAVKVLNDDAKGNGEEFINEVGTLGQIHHVNVVRLVGYCADGCRRALVYEFLPNNSLEKFVRPDKDQMNLLGWEKLHSIALGIAKGIEYLHQCCAQQILHFDIKPHNILLDQNFNPKLSDFGLAKLCSKDKSIVSMTAARGTVGYIAPEVFSRNFGNVSTKSDVYSFGMVLLEMVGGKNKSGMGNNSEAYFPEWIYYSLDRGEGLGVPIEKEGDAKIAKQLTVVGLWCIQWHPIDRPSMKVVIQMLEGEESLPMPPNPFGTTNPSIRSAKILGRQLKSELEIISESE